MLFFLHYRHIDPGLLVFKSISCLEYVEYKSNPNILQCSWYVTKCQASYKYVVFCIKYKVPFVALLEK